MKKTRKAALLASMLLTSSALIFTGCPNPTAPGVSPSNGSEHGNNNGGQTGGDEGKNDIIDISSLPAIKFSGSELWWNNYGALAYEIDVEKLTVKTVDGSSGCFNLNEKVAVGDKLVVNYTSTGGFKFKPVAPDAEFAVSKDKTQFVYTYESIGTLKQLGIVGTEDAEIKITKAALVKVETNEILKAAITTATTTKEKAVVGDKSGQYPQSAVDALAAAITTATTVKDAAHTRAEYDAAAAVLEEALKTFNESVNKEEGELIPFASNFKDDKWIILTAESVVTESTIVTSIGEVAGGDTWSNQVKAPAISSLPAGKYTFKVKINATVARKVQLLVQEQNGNWAVAFKKDIDLKEGENVIEETFTTTADVPNCSAGLMLGYIGGVTAPASSLTISGISLKAVKE